MHNLIHSSDIALNRIKTWTGMFKSRGISLAQSQISIISRCLNLILLQSSFFKEYILFETPFRRDVYRIVTVEAIYSIEYLGDWKINNFSFLTETDVGSNLEFYSYLKSNVAMHRTYAPKNALADFSSHGSYKSFHGNYVSFQGNYISFHGIYV